MAYRMGIDLGTASVGLVCLELDQAKQPVSIPYHIAHIFQEPVKPAVAGGVGATKASTRGSARRIRRLIDRRSRRLKNLVEICRLLGIEPKEISPDNGKNLHEARSKAVTEPVDLSDLARIFFRMSKRRGYACGFRVKKEGDEGQVQGGISRLKELMAEADCKWLGQYLLHRFDNGETLKLKEAGLYVDREMVETEFNQIWSTQAQTHQVLNKKHGGIPIRQLFYNTLFYQRPLKSVAAMVGNCSLEPNLPRAPMCQPAAQVFRIEKQIADLRWGMGRRSQPLSTEQKSVIRDLLNRGDKATFLQIYKELDKAGCPKPENRALNFDRPSRPELIGNRTLKAMDKLGLADDWEQLDEKVQISILNFIADMGSPQEVDCHDWHLRYKGKSGKRRKFSEPMVDFINRMVDSDKFGRFSKMGFDTGRSAYSIKALKAVSREMQSGLDEYEAIDKLYPENDEKLDLQTYLEPHKPTGNIVVDVALRQLRYAINNAIDAMGSVPPSEIIVELSHDIGLGLKRRGEIEKRIGKNQRERKKACTDLEANNHPATSTNIFRWRLWHEQDTNCPYCERKMGLGDAVDGSITNLEHIVPRGLTRVGRQQDHIMLAHRECNDEKGDRTPWQAWGGDADKWKIITERAKALEKKKRFMKARLLTLQDWKAEVIDSATIENFTNRQYHQTSWIAKLSTQWMRTICPDVSVSRGKMTAHLRRIWGLNTVIPEVRYASGLPVFDTEKNIISKEDFDKCKPYWEGHNNSHSGVQRTDSMLEKRIDHRHHAIDALVIALTTRSLYQKMAQNYKVLADKAYRGEKVRLTLSVCPPLKQVRQQALEMVRHHHILHKPDRYIGGSLFKDTAYGAIWVENERDPNADPEHQLTLRVKLTDLAGRSNRPDTIKNKIMGIASLETRKLILDAFEAGIRCGKSPDKILVNIRHPQYHTPIKKVRVLRESVNTAERIEFFSRNHSEEKPLYKYLQHDGYAYLEVDESGEKIETRPVSPVDALRKNDFSASNTTRLFKGDTIEDTKDNKVFVLRQIKAQNNGKLFLVPVTEAREVSEMTKDQGLRTVSGAAIARLRLVPNAWQSHPAR